MKEEKLKIEDLADTVAMMSVALQTQNDVLIVLLDKLNINDLPDWKAEDDVTDAVGPKLQACINLMGKINGQRETDKS